MTCSLSERMGTDAMNRHRLASLKRTVGRQILWNGLGAALSICTISSWAGSAAAQTCSGYWNSTGYFSPGWGASRLAVVDLGTGPRLYAGGRTIYPGVPSSSQPVAVQRWDGHSWAPVVLNVGGECNILAELEDSQGKFLFVGGVASPRWARIFRPASGWSLPPPGMFSGTTPEAAPWKCLDLGSGPTIYGGVQLPDLSWGVAKWDGAAWQMLGGTTELPSFTAITTMLVGSTRQLVVAGTFTHIGAVPCDRVARWTGTQWVGFSPLPAFGYVRDLCTFDDGTGEALYVGGDSSPSGTEPSYPIRKWDGQAWQPLTARTWSAYGSSVNAQVSNLHVFNDGRGPALFVAGYFSSAGSAPAQNLARWDGHAWEGVPGGVGFQTYAMVDYTDTRGPSLFLSGDFTTAGGGTSPGVAQYVGCPNCYTNCDLSNAAPKLNVNDFMCFMNAYALRDPYANCNLDNTINAADFVCFMNKFAAGCT